MHTFFLVCDLIYLDSLNRVTTSRALLDKEIETFTLLTVILRDVQVNTCKYSRTSMARTSLISWKFVLDIGNLSNRGLTLRKHAYSNTLKILQPKKKENFGSDIFVYISALNIDCGTR